MLRLGLASVFVAAAVSAYINPDLWVQYIPKIVGPYVPTHTILYVFEVYELLLAFLILIKRKVSWAALLAAITLLGIAILNIGNFMVVFENIGLAFAALALFAISKTKA